MTGHQPPQRTKDGFAAQTGDTGAHRGDAPLLSVDRAPSACGCGVGDPSSWARSEKIPSEQSVADPDGWCFGLLRYDVALAPDETWWVHLDCPQQTHGNLQHELSGTAVPAHAARFRARGGCRDLRRRTSRVVGVRRGGARVL